MGAMCSKRSTAMNTLAIQPNVAKRDKRLVSLAYVSEGHSPLPYVSLNGTARAAGELIEDSDIELKTERQCITDEGNAEGRKRIKLGKVLFHATKTVECRNSSFVFRKRTSKVNELGSLLGKASIVGLEKAVEVLDTVGSSLTNLNSGSGFAAGVSPKGNRIGILAFEVANTIVKGCNLKKSLSDENVKILKEEVLQSEGVQRLVSTDMAELLRVASLDKRNELKIFTGEVVRFGNLCRDPQWHQLDRCFEKLDIEVIIPCSSREEVETEMQHLMCLAQFTADLYHEWNALDRFEREYRRKLQEKELFNNYQTGDSLAALKSEIKSQKKHVKNLKKMSLWSRILEEVVEKLVDIGYFLQQEIQGAFGYSAEDLYDKKEDPREGCTQKLGPSGLALHYANIINQIDSMVSRPSSIPANIRENLYQGLPPHIKACLRIKLTNYPLNEEITVPQIKAEMEKTLSWLVPVAVNTVRAHHGFGWVGEWANAGSAIDSKFPGPMELALLETLYHAEQRTTEKYIQELIVLLHHLVLLARSNALGNKSPIKSPIHSPSKESIALAPTKKPALVKGKQEVAISLDVSIENQEVLKAITNKRFFPRMCKSQEFDSCKNKDETYSHRLSKSSSHSPGTTLKDDNLLTRCHLHKSPRNLEFGCVKSLDIIDRVDSV